MKRTKAFGRTISCQTTHQQIKLAVLTTKSLPFTKVTPARPLQSPAVAEACLTASLSGVPCCRAGNILEYLSNHRGDDQQYQQESIGHLVCGRRGSLAGESGCGRLSCLLYGLINYGKHLREYDNATQRNITTSAIGESKHAIPVHFVMILVPLTLGLVAMDEYVCVYEPMTYDTSEA